MSFSFSDHNRNLAAFVLGVLLTPLLITPSHAIECERYYLDTAGFLTQESAETSYPASIVLENEYFKPVKGSQTQMTADSRDMDFMRPEWRLILTLMPDGKLIAAYQARAGYVTPGIARYNCDMTSYEMREIYEKRGTASGRVKAGSLPQQCSLEFERFRSPQLSSCSFTISKNGNAQYIVNNRKSNLNECLRKSGLDLSAAARDNLIGSIEQIKGGGLTKEKFNLNLQKIDGQLTARVSSQISFSEPLEFSLEDNGVEYSSTMATATGIVMSLKLDPVLLELQGDFGTLDFSGICNAESISTGTNMNIDKAKSTCTELGFQSGTEKHGECVLKLMDR